MSRSSMKAYELCLINKNDNKIGIHLELKKFTPFKTQVSDENKF